MEELERLVELGTWAPSGSNAQAWEFVVLNKKDDMKRFLRFAPGLFEVPGAMIFICTDEQRSLEKGGMLGVQTMSVMDAAMAAQNIMLAAYEEGIASCALKGYDEDAVSLLLGLPDYIRPDLLIILGYPRFEAKAPARRGLQEVMHKGGWENE